MMNGLDRITDRILADAREKARGILEAAQNDCRRAAADYAAEGERIREEITEQAMAESEDIIARSRSAVAMTHRDVLMRARAEMLDEVFVAAGAHICDTDYGKYRELLVALLSSALIDQAKSEQTAVEMGDEIVFPERYEVFFNAQDAERFGRRILEDARRLTERRIGADRAAKLCLAGESVEIDGGLVLRCGDTEVDCSLSALLATMRRDLEGRISKILFD